MRWGWSAKAYIHDGDLRTHLGAGCCRANNAMSCFISSVQKDANEQTAYLHKGLFIENIFHGLASIQPFLLYYISVTTQCVLDDSRSANEGSFQCGKTGKCLNTCLKFPSCVIKFYKLNTEGFKFPSFKNFTFLKYHTAWLNKVPSTEGIFIRSSTPSLGNIQCVLYELDKVIHRYGQATHFYLQQVLL